MTKEEFEHFEKSAEQWDNRELGATEEFVEVCKEPEILAMMTEYKK